MNSDPKRKQSMAANNQNVSHQNEDFYPEELLVDS